MNANFAAKYATRISRQNCYEFDVNFAAKFAMCDYNGAYFAFRGEIRAIVNEA